MTSATNSIKETMDYSAEGFTLVTVKVNLEASELGCRVLLYTERGQVLDPLELDEAQQIDGSQLWIKYTAQRRMSRCAGSQPVAIDEIKMP